MTKFASMLGAAFLGAVIFYLIANELAVQPEGYEAEIAILNERLLLLEEAASNSSTVQSSVDASQSNEQLRVLEAAGFSDEVALGIVANEQEIRSILDAANRRREDPRPEVQSKLLELKALLGEESYAEYMEASGRTVSIEVESLLAEGIAFTAGLQQNDRIIRYGGERVYTPIDLDFAIKSHSAAKSIELEFIRDGETLLISTDPGALGIKASNNYQL